ncbi:hypothetical protein [Brevundimonas pishanensis]|uniref:hypothetical protein n=1 Tax=Brevundimonas pishanensis TaxID=2896315 RepID=UPI001FA7DA7D|nr:hypothetical protein [Brevundimonas pishanensis]
MNAYLVKFSLRSIAVVAVCGAVSACATNPPTDPSSPLVAEIEQKVAQKRDYPRLEDFPLAPVNVPTPAYVRTAVNQLEQSQAGLNRQISAIDWTLDDDAEQYAASLRQRIAQDRVEIPTLSTPAEIEAFAQSLRQRAKAPPPVDRPLR